jgi:hypothetical protein
MKDIEFIIDKCPLEWPMTILYLGRSSTVIVNADEWQSMASFRITAPYYPS